MGKNGEFKGQVITDIKNIKEDIKELKDMAMHAQTKLDQLSIDVNSLKIKAQIWGGIAGLLFALAVQILSRYL